MQSLRVLSIVPGTSVDGPGLRTSIYFAGCSHHCPGCHNPQSWDPHGGTLMTIGQIMEVVEENGFNVTFSGGDPLFNPDLILPLARQLKSRGYNIWCYTGYLFENIVDDPGFQPLLSCVDVLVDGPFIENLRNIHLRFRGSENQRLLDMPASLAAHAPIPWTDSTDIF